MRTTRSAAVLCLCACLCLAAACGTRRADTSAAPTPTNAPPGNAIVVDKDQVVTSDTAEGVARSLIDALTGAVPPAAAVSAAAPASPSPAPSVEQVFIAEVLKKGHPSPLPDPGSGPGDPRLRQSLLVDYEGVHESTTTPGVVVALPAAEGRAVEFISPPRTAGLFHGSPVCRRWNEGSWRVALRDFNRHGVQIAATWLGAAADEAWRRPAEFAETIVTGSAVMLSTLGDPAAMASCRKFSGVFGRPMSVKPFPVPPLGSRSWAFRVFEDKSVTQWAEVVQTPRYVLEIRIPRQWPKPRVDPAVLLPRITEAAYARAEAALA